MSDLFYYELIETGLAYLGSVIDTYIGVNPTANNGETYSNEVFTLRAYYWGNDEDIENLPNFECGDFSVVWYKHVRRGLDVSCSEHVTTKDFIDMIQKCVESVITEG